MSKKAHKAVLGRDFSQSPSGIIVVNRCCPDLRWPYDSTLPIPDFLANVDHTVRIKKKKYKKLMRKETAEINQLVREELEKNKLNLIVVLQGRDGAGKTGARKIIEDALDYDAKLFQATCIGPPTEDERAHPFLWRFSTGERMPRFGQVRVFDRSWAERLLVEPVMGYAKPEEVQNSYAQIRTFEWLAIQQGAVLVKFWMDISSEEQERRFKARAKDKPWKLSESDQIAREHWDDYTRYANEMFVRTGTDFAPWHIISSEDKRYSRVHVLRTINEAIAARLGK
jgi:polyphosphate kinase 2 (PPK2 family)